MCLHTLQDRRVHVHHGREGTVEHSYIDQTDYRIIAYRVFASSDVLSTARIFLFLSGALL